MRRLALLALWLLSSAALAEQPLASYPGTTLTRIGDDLVISGEYYRLAYFVTDDPIRKVAAHFARAFADEGISTMVDGNLEREAVVSAFFTREGLVRSIVLLPHGKRTLAFSVLKDLWVRESGKAAAPLPPLEGSRWSGDVKSRDGSARGFHRSSVVEKSLSEARDGLLRTLKREGWTPVNETDVRAEGQGKQRVLVHSRGAEQVVSTLLEAEPGVTVVTQAIVTADQPKPAERSR